MKQGFLAAIKDIIQDRKNGIIDEEEFLGKVISKFDEEPSIKNKKQILNCILAIIPDKGLELYRELL